MIVPNLKTADVVVVIDPGHGGENLGAEFENFTEKEMTMKVANAMYDKLSEFEGIKVYLTREADADLTLKERVDVAKEKGADFFFCLHFNMSVNHDLYGSETWISSKPSLYAKGYDFSSIEMSMLTDLGLFDRGIKTKLKKNNKDDYYGVIRQATAYNIPSVIIEHCHLDNKNDQPYYHENTDAWLRQYGELDAVAVAKYYGLYNPMTGEDYRDIEIDHIEVPSAQVKPDTTDPEVANLSLLEINYEEGYASLSLEGKDSDCRLLYYAYSTDAGETSSERYVWDAEEDTVRFDVPLLEGRAQYISGLVYNLFDRRTVSNEIELPAMEVKEVISSDVVNEMQGPEESQANYSFYQEIEIPQSIVSEKKSANPLLFILLALCILVVLVSTFVTALSLSKSKRRRNKRLKK